MAAPRPPRAQALVLRDAPLNPVRQSGCTARDHPFNGPQGPRRTFIVGKVLSLRLSLMAGVNHRARSHKCKLILNIISRVVLINYQHPLMVAPDLFHAPLIFYCPWGQGKCLPQAPKAVNLCRSDGSFLPTLTPEFSENSMNIRTQQPSELSCRLPIRQNQKVKECLSHSNSGTLRAAIIQLAPVLLTHPISILNRQPSPQQGLGQLMSPGAKQLIPQNDVSKSSKRSGNVAALPWFIASPCANPNQSALYVLIVHQ